MARCSWRRINETLSTVRNSTRSAAVSGIGFGVLVALLAVAGIVARALVHRHVDRIAQSLAEVQAEASLASQLSADIAKTIEAGRAISTRVIRGAERRSARSVGPRTKCSAQMNEPAEPVGGRSRDRRDDRQQAVGDGSLITRSPIASPTSAARRSGAERRDEQRAASIDELLGNIERLGAVKAKKVGDGAGCDLAARPTRRSAWLLVLIGLAVVLGIVVVMYTVRRHRRAARRSRATRASPERRRPLEPRRRRRCRASSASSPRR